MHGTTRLPALVLTACLVLLAAAPGALAEDPHGATPAVVEEHHDAPAAAAEPEHGLAHDDAVAHGDASHADAAHEEHAHHSDIPHLQNVIGMLAGQLEANAGGHETPTSKVLRAWTDPIFSFVAILIVAIFFISIGARMRDRDPGRRQLFAELVLGSLYGMFEQVLGKDARRFTPYLGTLFLFILVNNWMGMVPGGHASTSSFANTTIGLGVLTFLYVQYVGIKENGLGGYLYHFAGQPKSGIEWGFAILIFPLEVMGEFIKPLSLSLRLFGNIFGEDTLIAVMVILGWNIVRAIAGTDMVPGVPLQFPFYFLGLLASTVQALVFTILSTIYIALMLPHGHDEAEAHAHGHA